ncbi:hypothetical protein [Bradyrhizobium sp. Ai1a-2]|uniref:hypothetical protein n=1 Tax=Bradyrhizobium sp. Ai1a-2 TaxID=196490 RepID=UPI0019170F87|nr:hypothetical protein [Bradyrhizobium sp. Ai1a-2]
MAADKNRISIGRIMVALLNRADHTYETIMQSGRNSSQVGGLTCGHYSLFMVGMNRNPNEASG